MLTPLQKEKQSHYFRLVDLDGDGFVTASDWAEIGRNLAALRGMKRDSPAYDAIMATMGTVWANLSHYSSHPNRENVSENDWLQFEDERVVNCDEEWYEIYVNTIVRGVFALLDSDGNGWIGQGEYIDLAMSFWVPPQEAVAAFLKLDGDGDGRIYLEQFVHHVLDFHRSDDAETPGNWFFGSWRKR